ncbi:hypothetical protein CTAYLR_004837 [Chrysophaeum taylorii]|uniref:Uncharacterized protein n=1 Tax=Chrysophaeum taylorii TaxID=2483200 RepID=A0AAD7XM75_9STRA|nr:hypothetical protein CTAYLR_004837 [Chrysophaeum taylorii]
MIVDLTNSDDEEEEDATTYQGPPPMGGHYLNGGGQHQRQEAQQQPQVAANFIIQAALQRASSYSSAASRQASSYRQQQQQRQQLIVAQARQQLYGSGGAGGVVQGGGLVHQSALYYYSPLTLSVASPTTFKVTCEGALAPAAAEVARSTPGAIQNKEGAWELPLSQHMNFCVALEDSRIACDRIPQRVLNQIATANASDGRAAGNSRMDDDGYARATQEADSNAVSDIPRSVWSALAPFQRAGVSWIVRNNGRALLADEPGLGKTIQAIGAACAYRHEWPVLVVSPSSARFHWEAEFRQWLPDEAYLPQDAVLVVTSEKSAARQYLDRALVIVMSYDLVHRDAVKKSLARVAPNIVICDECHYLKNGKAQRTKALLPLLKAARRAILLSGTPALSRPIEVFWQLHALDARQWADSAEFHKRYCSNKDGSYSAASHLEELHTLLRATLMLRRNKAAILTQLPPKRRVRRRALIDDKDLAAQLRADLDEFRERASELAQLSKSRAREKVDDARKEMAAQKKALLMELFRRTGRAKLPAIERRVRALLATTACGKLLVFAHHRVVLDSLADGCLSNTPYVRIDGSTPAKERQARVTKFQNDATVRVALLGITAAGVALTLTAASRVLFAELYWTPAALLQAEDRAHRIGQTSEVVIEYLLADDCVDDVLWPCIQHKMLLLGELFENQKQRTMRADDEDEEYEPQPLKRHKPDLAGSDDVDDLLEFEELEELHHEDPEALDLENLVDDNQTCRRSILVPAPSASSPQQVKPRPYYAPPRSAASTARHHVVVDDDDDDQPKNTPAIVSFDLPSFLPCDPARDDANNNLDDPEASSSDFF